MFGNNKIKPTDPNVVLKQHERVYFVLSLIAMVPVMVLAFLFLRFTVGALIGLITDANEFNLIITCMLFLPSVAVAAVAVLLLIRLIRQHVKIMNGKYDITIANVSDRLGDFLQYTMTLYDETSRITEVESSFLINRKIRNESKILYAVIEGEKNRVIIPNCRAITLSKGRLNVVDLEDPTEEIKAIVREGTSRKRKQYLISDSLFMLAVFTEILVNIIAYITDSSALRGIVSVLVFVFTTILVIAMLFLLDAKGEQISVRIVPCMVLGFLTVMVINLHIFVGLIASILWIAAYFFWRRTAKRMMKDLYDGKYKVSEGTVIHNEALFSGEYTYHRYRYNNVSRIEIGIWGNHVFMYDGTDSWAPFGRRFNEFSYKVRASNGTIYDVKTNRIEFNKHPVGYVGLLIVRYDPYLQEDEAILL